MPLTESFIRRGFIPSELIPPFKSESLADALALLPHDFSSYGKPASRCCYHSIPKLKHFRRLIGVPNPLHQTVLAQILESQWGQIKYHLNKSRISLSVVEEDGNQHALRRKVALDDLALERSLRSASARFILRTDLSRFYQTLYTHSISWALHSKAIAKKQRSVAKLAGNNIDFAVRNTQDQQTIGIPVGPETSDLIAEIIGAAIDEQLQDALPELVGIRYVDDFDLYFGTRGEAEEALAILIATAREYELEINQSKTAIVELPESLEPRWKTELRSFVVRPELQHQDLLGFFSRAFELANMFPGNNVLKYAVARSSGVSVEADNWPLYESLLLTCLIGEPALFPIFGEVLIKYRDEGYPLNLEKLANTLWEICRYHCKLRQGFEAAWALWLAKLFELIVPDEVAACIATLDDPIVAIVALDLRDNGLIRGLDTAKWEISMTGDDLYSSTWLVSYEANIKGWMPSKHGDDYIGADPFFSALRRLGVFFYDLSEGRPALPSMWTDY